MLDKELLQAISQGDEQAFAYLYKRYYAKLNQFLNKISYSNSEISIDILQEVFLRVWVNRAKLVEIENFQAWIYKVVSVESLNHIRKEAHLQKKADRLVDLYNNNSLSKCEIPRLMEFDEIKRIISETIQKMPERRRRIYLMSREEGKSAKEISEILQISQNTVYNSLTTSLSQIRAVLSQYGYLVSLAIISTLNFY